MLQHIKIMVSSTLLHYFKRTTNLCIFKLGSHRLPPTLCFPKASTVTLINCSREGVSNILKPSIFPDLNQIHYLSTHPGTFDLHTRFPKSVSWLFPNPRYAFYKCMMEAGFGRIENRLINTYVRQFSKNSHMIQIDLHIPGFGTVDGSWYANQMKQYLSEEMLHKSISDTSELPPGFSYLYTPNPNLFDEEYQYFEYGSAMNTYVDEKTRDDFFRHLMEDFKEDEKNK
jgi:hypothetical protein